MFILILSFKNSKPTILFQLRLGTPLLKPIVIQYHSSNGIINVECAVGKMVSLEILELFTALESNQPDQVQDTKSKINAQFNQIREPWLLHGMYDYYMVTDSQRAAEILINVQEPHDKHLFNKLGEDLQTSRRLQALTLLGYVVKRQPAWLMKITQHSLLKELIKILNSENEIITIISDVLVISILLTIIPGLIAPYLPEIFEGYSRLAAWNVSQKNRYEEIQLFHLQISLYVLFVQLYSMYPCSFIMFLKQKYSKDDNLLVFTHTVKPMLETMRMHPNFIISREDVETSVQRWKKVQQHDVVMECTKYTLLENGGQNPACCINNEFDMSSALDVLKSSIGANGDITTINSVKNEELWSPILCCEEHLVHRPIPKFVPAPYHKPSFFNHNEHSPPEAAIEATPETTPIRDVVYQQSRLPSANSSVVRALNTFGLESVSRRNSSSPNSQPSSPLKKEGFVFPHGELQSQAISRRMDRMLMERYQLTDSNKDENNGVTESRSIATQIQPSVNPEILKGDEEDVIECDQQSNGSPCRTYEGGLHMPISSSWKGFFNHRRYHSQCTPENNVNAIGQSTGSSPQREADFSVLSVRRANSCPEIKKTNGNSISSSTSPLHEETEEKIHSDDLNVSNGHASEICTKKAKIDNHLISVQNSSTQTENVLPYEHLFYSVYPVYNDLQNSSHQQNVQQDDSFTIIENYVRTSAIVLKHRNTSASTDDVELLKHQIMLLTLQLQFERNRREVHAERNRRLLGKSRFSRSLDENNSALQHQVKMLNIELSAFTSELESLKQSSSKQIKELKESVTHWQDKCLKYQMETKEAENKHLSSEQLYNGERLKTAELTKQLSETKAELFNTQSELTIVQAAANVSKELSDTVATLQRELVMRGEMQSRQRDITTQVNNVRYDAINAMLSQESCKNQLSELQEKLSRKSMMLDASNVHINNLEIRLMEAKSCVLRDKRDMDEMKEQFHKELSEMKEKYRVLEQRCCLYEEIKVEEESKKRFLDQFPQFSFDAVVAESVISMDDQEAEHMLDLAMAADPGGSRDDVIAANATPK